MAEFFTPSPSLTNAYHNDGTHEYFGKGPKGANTTDPRWSIFKIEYDVSYSTAGDNWIIKYPEGTDAPKFKWSDVATLSYYILGKDS